MGGVPMNEIPGYGTMRQAVADELEANRATITVLESLDDDAAREWAASRGVR